MALTISCQTRQLVHSRTFLEEKTVAIGLRILSVDTDLLGLQVKLEATGSP